LDARFLPGTHDLAGTWRTEEEHMAVGGTAAGFHLPFTVDVEE
jgi:hypothetical protein